MKVLAVDDDPTTLKVLKDFLTRFVKDKALDTRLVFFSDPVECLFEVTQNGHEYGLILLDVRLPHLSGDDIYNSLIYVHPELLGRIVFVTGFPEDLTKRFPDADFKILPKPFRYEDFCKVIEPFLIVEANL